MCFLIFQSEEDRIKFIFQPKDMFKLFLNVNESQSIYALRIYLLFCFSVLIMFILTFFGWQLGPFLSVVFICSRLGKSGNTSLVFRISVLFRKTRETSQIFVIFHWTSCDERCICLFSLLLIDYLKFLRIIQSNKSGNA